MQHRDDELAPRGLLLGRVWADHAEVGSLSLPNADADDRNARSPTAAPSHASQQLRTRDGKADQTYLHRTTN
jgi:hypothetical protein